jgi:hypothetical protein
MMPVFPWWNRVGVMPQAFSASTSVLLEGGVLHAFRQRLFPGVLFVVPRKAGFDLLEPCIHRIPACQSSAVPREHPPDDTAVAVALVPYDDHCFSIHERREVLLRAIAISLAPLGCIDAGEPHFVLLIRFFEDRYRVAVGDADDFAEKLCWICWCGQQQQEPCDVSNARCYSGSPRPRLCLRPRRSTRPSHQRHKDTIGESESALYASR